MTTNPGMGHLHAMVPIAQALQQAKHEVAFACSASLCPTLEALDFKTFPAGLDWLESERERAFPELSELPLGEQELWLVAEVFADAAALPMTADLLALGERWKPDVIVRNDYEFGGCVAAERLGIPSATIGLDFFMPMQVWEKLLGRSRIAYLRSAYGLPPEPALDMLYPFLHLTYVPPSFQPPDFPTKPVVHPLRTEMFDRSGGESLPGWIEELPDRPTVYVGLGTVFNDLPQIFDIILDGLYDEPINLIMTVGRNQDPAQFGSVPEHIHIEQYIPLSLLLSHCDLAIMHTGFNSILTAFRHGVPLLIIPISTHQSLQGLRCRALGISEMLKIEGQEFPPGFKGYSTADIMDLTPDTIRSTVRELLNNPSYRQAVQRMRAEIESLPGTEYAVELLVELVETHPRQDRTKPGIG